MNRKSEVKDSELAADDAQSTELPDTTQSGGAADSNRDGQTRESVARADEGGQGAPSGEPNQEPVSNRELATNSKPEVTQRDLRKLKRAELLEIMLAQSEEIDRLRAELAEKDRQLRERTIAIEQSGSIAEAALKLTQVFEEAQKAADLYLDNVKQRAGGRTAEGVQADAAGADGETAAEAPADHAMPVEAVKPATKPEPEAEPTVAANPVTPAPAPAAEPKPATPTNQVKPEHSSKHREKAAFTYTLPTSITWRESAAPEATEDDSQQAPKSDNAAPLPPKAAGAEVNEYKPGSGLKAIEELIDDMKVSGAKHRG